MKWTIGKKITLLGVIPSLAIVFFLYVVLAEKISVKHTANNVNELSQYIINSSKLVHNLQKERGASAVHIGSGGKEMKTELESITQETDNTLASLQNFLASFDAKRYGPIFSSNINSAMDQLGELSLRRDKVDSLSVSKGEATRYYTAINSYFIQSFESVVLQANHPQITAPISAYVNFLSAKELAGIERAVMSGIMASNKPVDSGTLSKWMTFWKGQEKLMNNFEYLASKEVLSFYRSNHTGKVVEDVLRIRNTLLEKANEGNYGVTGKETFMATTRRIDVLKDIENYQSNALQSLSASISSVAKRSVIIYSSIGGVILAVVFYFIYYFTTNINILMRNVIRDLTKVSSILSSASRHVSESSQTVAQGSAEQASSLEETSSTMEEMSTMTKLNADNAQEAANLAQKCNNSAEKGNAAVSNMCDSIDKMNSTSMEVVKSISNSMDEINASSNEIAEITKVIDSIAFQTNLLALNAAVEAARAGDHGKGFAVVAEEVRNLAQRSASAAKDTAVLIKDCVEKADKGTELTNSSSKNMHTIIENVKKSTDNTSAALLEISNSVEKVTTLTNEISSASTEQSDGVSSVNISIQQMDNITQQNASNAEEVATTSDEMSSQAQILLELISDLELQVNGKYSNDELQNRQGNATGHEKNKSFTKRDHSSSHQHSNGGKNGGHVTTQNLTSESILPMEESGVTEHGERFSDF